MHNSHLLKGRMQATVVALVADSELCQSLGLRSLTLVQYEHFLVETCLLVGVAENLALYEPAVNSAFRPFMVRSVLCMRIQWPLIIALCTSHFQLVIHETLDCVCCCLAAQGGGRETRGLRAAANAQAVQLRAGADRQGECLCQSPHSRGSLSPAQCANTNAHSVQTQMQGDTASISIMCIKGQHERTSPANIMEYY